MRHFFCHPNCKISTWDPKACRDVLILTVQQCPTSLRSTAQGQQLMEVALTTEVPALPGGKLRSEEQLSLTGVHSAPGLATLTLTSAVGHLVCHPAPPHAHPTATGLCWQTPCVERRAPVWTKRCARCAQPQQKSAASNVGSPCPYMRTVRVKILSVHLLLKGFFLLLRVRISTQIFFSSTNHTSDIYRLSN